jgi:glutamyl-tRNA reductase
VASLCVLGLSHRTAPIDVREKMAVASDLMEETLRRLVALPGVPEAMIVSTCNRVEVYAAIDRPEAVELLRRTMIEGRALPQDLRAHLYCHEGQAALRHLFRVVSSLDSMVVGESQILGQVKDAFALAVELGVVGALLQRCLPRAFQIAKRVRSETDVARSSASIASAAVDLAAQIFGDLKGRAVLVLGAGKMGDLSARHLRSAGVDRLCVVNRTRARADELAGRLGGTAYEWDALDRLLTEVDIVLCSTGASEPVLRKDRIARAMRGRRGRWLFLIDIAVPRDVEPEVGNIESVYLYDVDALDRIVRSNMEGRAREADKAEALVAAELQRFHAAERTQGVVPTIKALRARFHDVALAEVERVAGRLDSKSDKDHALLKQLAEAIANKLLHEPTTALKREAAEADAATLVEAVTRLYRLPESPESASTEPNDSSDRVADNVVPLHAAQDPDPKRGA